MSALSGSAPTAQLDTQPQIRRSLTAVPDRAAREAAAAAARFAFCEQMKNVRERRGITLGEIAERSKVSEGLFAALERGDVSRWPMGIYRRSFFRAYALALGVPIEAALGEFLLLFPEEGEQPISPALATSSGALRMTLAGRTWLHTSRLQVAAALIDVMMVAAITSAVAWWMPIGTGSAAAVVTVIYYSLATASLGCTPGIWWLRTRGYRKRAKAFRLAR
jgi:transcriptional regulator with XRE-family HTH domain